MRTGELARQAGVNEQTLRYYEREGLLADPPRTPNRYRDYPPESIALVRFIKRTQELGFSLDEARALSNLRVSPGRNRLTVRALAEAKLRDVEQRIADMTAIRGALRHLVQACCRNEDPRCPILEALDGSAHSSPVPSRKRQTQTR